MPRVRTRIRSKDQGWNKARVGLETRLEPEQDWSRTREKTGVRAGLEQSEACGVCLHYQEEKSSKP